MYVCVVVMMSSSLPTALPLTPEKARYRHVFQNTNNLGRLCSDLNIPDDKRNNAASASEHFIQSTEPMKVRKMVFWLDYIGDTALADTVMECAEPQQVCICSCGKEFCVVHLKLVMKQLEVIWV